MPAQTPASRIGPLNGNFNTMIVTFTSNVADADTYTLPYGTKILSVAAETTNSSALGEPKLTWSGLVITFGLSAAWQGRLVIRYQ